MSEHQYSIVAEVERLMDEGFTCYLEHEFLVAPPTRKRLVVDIYAKKDKLEIIVEVGTLSNIHGNRLELLKTIKPQAKIVHITQWKNFISSGVYWQLQQDTLYQRYVKSDQAKQDMQKMGESLSKV